MSGHRHHIGRMPPSSGSSIVPPAPPPPVLSRSRNRRSRSRSRSRSRTPLSGGGGRNNRFAVQRQDSRDGQRDRERGRRISRSRSPLPFSRLNSAPLPHSQNSVQSINLIAGEGIPVIMRRILDPETVKIPRRLGEGAGPIFERAELKEAMRRRFAVDDEDEPRNSAPLLQNSGQRVIAIIREPALQDSYRMSNKDQEFGGRPVYPKAPLRNNSPRRATGSGFQVQQPQRSVSPPIRERDARNFNRERPNAPMDRSMDRKRDLLEEIRNRETEFRGNNRGGERELEQGRGGVPNKDNRNRIPNPRQQQRSPVRILRDRGSDRGSRSRSHTPPPMPPEIRRQMMERQSRQRDLRSKLSRPAFTKFDGDHGGRDSGSFRGRDSGTFRGRGGFRGRGAFRGREDTRSRGGRHVWEHDMFERDGVDGDLKSSKT